MQREHAIRQLAKLEGYRLEKKGDDSYRLINARFNVAVYLLDGVSLEKRRHECPGAADKFGF